MSKIKTKIFKYTFDDIKTISSFEEWCEQREGKELWYCIKIKLKNKKEGFEEVKIHNCWNSKLSQTQAVNDMKKIVKKNTFAFNSLVEECFWLIFNKGDVIKSLCIKLWRLI